MKTCTEILPQFDYHNYIRYRHVLNDWRDILSQSRLVKLTMCGIFFAAAFRQLRILPMMAPSDFLIVFAIFQLLSSSFFRFSGVHARYFLFSLFILCYLVIISVMVSADPNSSIINFIKVFFSFTLLPILIRFYTNSLEKFNELYWSLFCGVILSNFIDSILNQTSLEVRAPAFTGHPVYNGVLIAISLVGILSFNFESIRYKLLAGFCAMFLIYALVRTASTTGFAIVAIFCIVYGITKFRLKSLSRTLISSVLFLAFFAIFSFSTFFSYVRQRIQLTFNPRSGYSTMPKEGVSTLDARVESLRASWNRIKESPVFGYGLDLDGRSTEINLEPHNIFFLSWQTGGIVMLFISLCFFSFSFKYLLVAIRRKATLEASIIMGVWFALLTGPIIYDRSILAPLFLALLSPRVRKQPAIYD